MVDPALSPPFKDLLLFLATAGVVVPLFTRLRVGATLGFLTAGVALGPFGLGALTDEAPWLEALTIARPEEFEQLAELGVAFLLFSIGLELSWERLRLMRRLVFGLGTVQLAVATLALGGALAGGGEFAFVILGHASGAEIVPAALMRPLLVAVTLSMFATPGLVALGGYLERRVSARDLRRDPSAPPPERRGRVIIVGMGRVGRLVADILDERGLAWTAVDRDPRAVSAERRRGRLIHFGDGSRIELLDRIGLAEAPALVVTMDAPDGVEAVVGTARHHHPDLVIVARARDDRHAARLYRLGATSAVPEAFEASLQLSEALLLDLGEPSDDVGELIRNRRRAFRDSISAPPLDEARR